MCLAIPSKVIEVDGMTALIDVSGARRQISLMLMPEPVALGEYVLVHAGFAIQKVDEEAASEALRLLSEIAEQMEADGLSCGDPFGGEEFDRDFSGGLNLG